MYQTTDVNTYSLDEPYSLDTSKTTSWSLKPKDRRRLILWAISVVLLVVAGSFLQDAIAQQSLIGIIVSGSWVAAVVVNSAIVDYLLRQKWVQ